MKDATFLFLDTNLIFNIFKKTITMNELNEFNTGGQHESNPMGGVPVGVNPNNGMQQTVEEGETMFDIEGSGFVYSTNFKLNSDDVNTFKLPKTLKGLNMADASKKISEMFKDREDSIATKTKGEFLKRIAEAQEVKKQEQEQLAHAVEMNNNEGYVDLEEDPLTDGQLLEGDGFNVNPLDEETGSVPPTEGGMMPFSAGGFLGMSGMTGGEAVAQGTGNAMGAIGGLMGMLSQSQGNVSPNSGMAALEGATSGAAVGTSILPGWGTAVGGAVGLMGGLMGSKKAQKRIDRKLEQNANQANNQYRDTEQFADGGLLNRNNSFIPLNPAGHNYNSSFAQPNITPLFNKDRPRSGTVTAITGQPVGIMNNFAMPNVYQSKPQTLSSSGQSTTGSGKFGLDGDNLARLAPVLNNLGQLNGQSKPIRKPPIIDTTKAERRYMDNESLVRGVDTISNNTINAINQMGGSTGARRAGILGSNVQRMRAMSDANAQTQAFNRQVDDRADALDSQTRAENIRRKEMSNENFDRDTGAYETNRSALQNTLFNSIGNIGLENRQEKTVGKMFGYTSKGDYIKGKNSDTVENKNSSNTNTVNKTPNVLGNSTESETINSLIGRNTEKKEEVVNDSKIEADTDTTSRKVNKGTRVVKNTTVDNSNNVINREVSVNPNISKKNNKNVNVLNNSYGASNLGELFKNMKQKEKETTTQTKKEETVNNENKTEKVKVETPQTKTPQIESKPKVSTDTTSRSKQQPEILDETSNNKSKRTSYNTHQSYSDYVYSVKNRTVGSNVPMSEEEYNKRKSVPKISNEINKITSDEKHDKNRDKKLKNRDSLLKYSSYQDYVNKVKAKNNNSKAAVLSEESFNSIRNYK